MESKQAQEQKRGTTMATTIKDLFQFNAIITTVEAGGRQ